MKARMKKFTALVLAVVIMMSQGISAMALENNVGAANVGTGNGTVHYVTSNGETTYLDTATDGSEGKTIISGEDKRMETNNLRKTEIITEPVALATPPVNDDGILMKQKDKDVTKLTAVEGEYIVKFKSGTTQSAKDKFITKYGLNKEKTFTGNKLVLVKQKDKTKFNITTIAAETIVERIEPNYMFYPQGYESSYVPEDEPGTEDPATDPVSAYDPLYDQLWGLNNEGQVIMAPGVVDVDIDAQEAWTITQGSEEVVIGIIDTGIDFNHPDLIDNMYTNPNEIADNGIDDDKNGYIDDIHGWDFFNDDNSVFDYIQLDDHGTHVAGTIAGSLNGLGVQGVAPQVKIMSLKFLGPDGGTLEDAIDAINYAKMMGVQILNNSWGGGGYSELLKEAIAMSGTVFVAAAGNEGLNVDETPIYPGAYDCDNIISVAAVDNQGEIAYFSNYGVKNVDIAAPGVDVLSSVPKDFEAGAVVATSNTVFAGFGLHSLQTPDERVDFMAKTLTHLGIDSTSSVLLVDDDMSFTGEIPEFGYLYADALAANGINFDVFETTDAQPTAELFASYDLVVWATGYASSGLNLETAINDQNQIDLMNYLDMGGKLYLSGIDAGWKIELTRFYQDYLNVAFVTELSKYKTITGTTGTAFDGTTYIIGDPFIDLIEPIDGDAIELMYYPGDTDYTTAYAYFGGTSMATPHVTGIAALVASQEDLSSEEIISRILRSGQPLAGVNGLVRTGDMANAYNALTIGADVPDADDDIPGVKISGLDYGDLDSLFDTDDVYGILVEAGQQITLKLNADGSSDFDLHLYAPDAVTVTDGNGIVASSENIGSYEEIKFYAEVSGVYYVDVYAYAGSGTYELKSSVSAGTLDDRSPRLQYVGNWMDINAPVHQNGTARSLNSVGSVSYSFTGDFIRWTGFKDARQGIAKVTIDGVDVYNVDLYSTVTKNKQILFEKALPYGQHTISIAWTGKWNVAAKKGSTWINIDTLALTQESMAPDVPVIYEAYDFVDSVQFRFSNSSDPSVVGYSVYLSPDGVNFELVDFIPDEYFGEWDGWYAYFSTNYVPHYFYIKAVNDSNIESDASNIVFGTPIMANSNYVLESDSNHLTYTGEWVTLASPLSDTDGLVAVTVQPGSTITIPVVEAMQMNIMMIGGPEAGTVKITYPDGWSDLFDLNTPEEMRLGFGMNSNQPFSGNMIVECISGKISFDSLSIRGVDYNAPASPTGLTAVYTENGVMLDWVDNSEPDVQGYCVQRTDLATGEVANMTAQPIKGVHYADPNVVQGGTYIYNIQAVDYANNFSEFSMDAAVTIGDVEYISTRYEEFYATTTGTWYSHVAKKNSEGAAIYAKKKVDSIFFNFCGTGITWIGSTSDSKGMAYVSIDGNPEVLVDTYSPTTLYQQPIYTISGLPAGWHTINIRVAGQKNPASSGTTVHVDAFDVQSIKDEIPPSAPYGVTANLSQAYSDVYVNISWLQEMTPDLAGYNIYRHDFGTGVTSKLNLNPYFGNSFPDFTAAEGSDYAYYIEAVDYSGNVSVPSGNFVISTPLTSVLVRYEEDLGIYSGTWNPHLKSYNSGGAAMMSSIAGSTVSYTFTGTGISWLGLANTSRGIAKVTLDGVSYTVDCYSLVSQYQKTFFKLNGLDYGTHTITIEVTGRKNPLSTNKMIHVDAFEVVGGDIPVPVTVEEPKAEAAPLAPVQEPVVEQPVAEQPAPEQPVVELPAPENVQ